MQSQKVERLLSSVRKWRSAAIALQFAIAIAGGWTAWKLSIQIEGKYLFHHPVAIFLVLAAVILFLACRAVFDLHEDRPGMAHRLDDTYHLQDRLTTYVELRNSAHPFLAALAGETETRIAEISTWRAAQLQRGVAAPAMFLLFALLGFSLLPYLPVPQKVIAQKEQQKQIRQQAKELSQQIAKLEKGNIPELTKLFAESRKTAKELQKPQTDPVEALKRLNALQEKSEAAKQNLGKSLAEKLKKDLSGTPLGTDATDAADAERIVEMAKEFQKSVGKDFQGGKEVDGSGKQQQLSQKELDQMKKALQKYDAEKAQSEKTLAELQRSLENAKDKIASGKKAYVTDSRINKRDLERGKSGVEDGPGTTNLDVGPQSFDTKKKQPGDSMEDRTNAEYEQSYKGQREKAGSDPIYLDNRWNDTGNPGYTKIRSFGLDSGKESNNITLEAASQDAGESQMEKERVPASYRKIVNQYFESIEKHD